MIFDTLDKKMKEELENIQSAVDAAMVRVFRKTDIESPDYKIILLHQIKTKMMIEELERKVTYLETRFEEEPETIKPVSVKTLTNIGEIF